MVSQLNPVRLSSMPSGSPPRLTATTGVPHSIDSGRTTRNVASHSMGISIDTVVDHAPVAAAGRAGVADGRADRGEVHALRSETRGLAHVLRIDSPHVRLDLGDVPREDERQVREAPEVVNHVEPAVVADE